jgi:NADPH-dependent curcumin reductase CurA
MTESRQWILARRPSGMVCDDDFALRTVELPPIADGEALAEMRWLSFEPAMRGWMDDRPSYMPPVEVGAVMRAPGVAEIVESRSPDYAVGDLVQGLFGWQEHVVIPAAGDRPRTMPAGLDPVVAMSALGGAALTAYFGLLDVGKPVAGETVVVSGAAGAVGSMVGQIAKIMGCRVVGTAGGQDKCDWLVRELGFDAAVDYKAGGVRRALAAACPAGIDVYFDNTGGAVLDAALSLMNLRGRIACCGNVSQYDVDKPAPGPMAVPGLVVTKRLRMEGFIVMDFYDRRAEAEQRLARWVAEGKIKAIVDIVDGLDKAPEALIGLFDGRNRGKMAVRVV